eukprot:scaffold2221_cov28-Tisochrysis_lutea.AAC.1
MHRLWRILLPAGPPGSPQRRVPRCTLAESRVGAARPWKVYSATGPRPARASEARSAGQAWGPCAPPRASERAPPGATAHDSIG